MTATSGAGSAFAGWTRIPCAGQDNPCTLTMTSHTSVIASFATAFTLDVRVLSTYPDGGSMTSGPAGISCPTDCQESYRRRGDHPDRHAGGELRLRRLAVPAPAPGKSCSVTLSADVTAVASFRRL